ncbi:MAG: M55 family metallopeptidase [Lachnospiraceae bacterium]|nr:M55 family metallopeptidase [Lachnospiraceae bacterium]
MKIFISADIEGTAGIVNWKETEPGDQYPYFAGQMTKEVSAACQGALSAGADEVLVRDAHDSARNLNPAGLPRKARILRGWTGGLYTMMDGLDESFSAAAMTGYHTCAASNGNPLAHTMTLQVEKVTLNGEPCSEFMINALIAAYNEVPVIFVSGDAMLCDLAKDLCPAITTVATSQGVGGGSIGMHPEEAQEAIQAGMEQAVAHLKEQLAAGQPSDCLIPLPPYFELEVTYRDHKKAYTASFYPGTVQTGPKTVVYEASDYGDVLGFMLFCM